MGNSLFLALLCCAAVGVKAAEGNMAGGALVGTAALDFEANLDLSLCAGTSGASGIRGTGSEHGGEVESMVVACGVQDFSHK